MNFFTLLVLGGSTSDRLQEMYKPALTDAECTSYVGTAYNPSTMLCAGDGAGGHDFCQVYTIYVLVVLCKNERDYTGISICWN